MTIQTFCPQCGAALAEGAQFCGSCGYRLSGGDPATAVQAGVEYAGFWIRLVSAIIDGVILFVVNLIVQFIVGGGVAGFIVGILIGIAYSVGFWVGNNGQTPGKMAVGIRVQMENGEPIDIGPAVLRYIGYYVSGLILLIGFIMIAFTPKKQGLHDYIAKTVVIKTR
jgi:uncharacterized RDD family membrane protein YckC